MRLCSDLFIRMPLHLADANDFVLGISSMQKKTKKQRNKAIKMNKKQTPTHLLERCMSGYNGLLTFPFDLHKRYLARSRIETIRHSNIEDANERKQKQKIVPFA